MTDSILFWNDVALEANWVSHTNGLQEQTGPPLSARALAIVHLAMHDAYVAADGAAGYVPYLPGLPAAPAGASASAAVTGAAYTALSALFPSQRNLFEIKLGQAGNVLDPGHEFGATVARAILQDRGSDPSVSAAGYVASPARGRHRADPDNPSQGYHAPFYGALAKGFAITDRHELLAPPLDTPEYIRALRQVRGVGIAPELMGTVPSTLVQRTVNQTMIGIYWGYDGAAGLGTPPRLYNQIVRQVAMAQGNTEAKNARLFALVNVAMADAGILAWDQKYIHDFWRPVVGIREHDLSMGLGIQPTDNLSNDTDPVWVPLGAPATNSMNQNFTPQAADVFPFNQAVVGRMKNFTPPFPAYPSGHATFGAAALHITRLFYGIASGHRGADKLFDK
ncbi:MAG: hypothetical protein AVDCRST_MAG93-4765, partial [uncultured Chloroflexia bacterium]